MSRRQSPDPSVVKSAAVSPAERALREEMVPRYRAHVDEARRLAQERKPPNQAVLGAAIRTETYEKRRSLPRDLELEHLTRVLRELEQEALDRLEQVMTIARLRVRDEPAEVARPEVPQGLARRQRPTIVANMAVDKHAADGDGLMLRWQPAAGVTEWTVRVEERRDDRSSYEEVETLTLPGASTSTTVLLGERSRRVALLGRRRDGRVVRRALISALTSDSWREQWQRKPSAA